MANPSLSEWIPKTVSSLLFLLTDIAHGKFLFFFTIKMLVYFPASELLAIGSITGMISSQDGVHGYVVRIKLTPPILFRRAIWVRGPKSCPKSLGIPWETITMVINHGCKSPPGMWNRFLLSPPCGCCISYEVSALPDFATYSRRCSETI